MFVTQFRKRKSKQSVLTADIELTAEDTVFLQVALWILMIGCRGPGRLEIQIFQNRMILQPDFGGAY